MTTTTTAWSHTESSIKLGVPVANKLIDLLKIKNVFRFDFDLTTKTDDILEKSKDWCSSQWIYIYNNTVSKKLELKYICSLVGHKNIHTPTKLFITISLIHLVYSFTH